MVSESAAPSANWPCRIPFNPPGVMLVVSITRSAWSAVRHGHGMAERSFSSAARASSQRSLAPKGAALSAADIATGPSAALAFVGDPSQEAWGMESGGGATPPLATGRGQEPGSMVC